MTDRVAKIAEGLSEAQQDVAQAIRDERVRWGWVIRPDRKKMPMGIDSLLADAAIRAVRAHLQSKDHAR